MRFEKPAEDMTDAELFAELEEAGRRFDAAREGDGHGGSPGEAAWERIGELDHEIAKRKASL